jgi:hypothetical protein
MDGARSDAVFFETRRHGEHRGGGLWVLGQRLRGLCGSVFFKVCAMDGARSDALFFETRRHGEHRGGGLWVLGQRLRGLCGSVFFKVCAMDGARSEAVFLKHGGTESTEEGGG